MKITKTIKVTKTGIAKGKKGDGAYCPVARAMRAVGFKKVLAGKVNLSYAVPSGEEYITTPREVTKFMQEFDSGQPVKPFTFRINTKTRKAY